MGQHHNHTHQHHQGHHHHDTSQMTERRLWWAVGANMILTVAQILGGLVSGSLSLIADALHNFSDAASLLIALIAIRIGRKPADEYKTFGYKRAETIAALINLNSLILIGLYLCYEAVTRFINPEPITGWIVIAVAGVALLIDIYTAILTYHHSKTSMNIRAAFLHNLTDAFASIGVIASGALIILYGWVWTDALITLVIAVYVLWHGCKEMPRVIHLLMEGTPDNIAVIDVKTSIENHKAVINAHHLHIWRIDESRNALEAHVVINGAENMDQIKREIKELLHTKFHIEHSTLEFEFENCESNKNKNGASDGT